MQSMLKIFLFAVLFFSQALGFEKVLKAKEYEIILSAPKNFTSGKNEFNVSVKQNGNEIEASDVAVKFMMPEMPGMPKMSEDSQMSKDGEKAYKGVVHFPHGGTWQIRASFKIDNKNYLAKGSIDF